MKNDPSVSFSDRDAARASAARLRGEKPPPVPAGSPAAPAFVSFRAGVALGTGEAARAAPAAVAPAAGQAPSPRRPPPTPLPGASGAERWDALLSWCLTSGGAMAAFVLDERSLLVASRGLLPFDDVEGMGGRLIVALEQASRLQEEGAPGHGAVSVDLDGRWLTGFAVSMPGGAPLTFGLLGAEPAHAEVRAAISGWIEAAFGR